MIATGVTDVSMAAEPKAAWTPESDSYPVIRVRIAGTIPSGPDMLAFGAAEAA